MRHASSPCGASRRASVLGDSGHRRSRSRRDGSMPRFVLRPVPGGRGSHGCAALCEFLIPPARVLPTGRPVDRVGSSNGFDAVRRLDRWRDNIWQHLDLPGCRRDDSRAAAAGRHVSGVGFLRGRGRDLFLPLHRRHVRRRRDAGPADQRSKLCLPLIRRIGLTPRAAGIHDAVHRREAPSRPYPGAATAHCEARVRL